MQKIIDDLLQTYKIRSTTTVKDLVAFKIVRNSLGFHLTSMKKTINLGKVLKIHIVNPRMVKVPMISSTLLVEPE